MRDYKYRIEEFVDRMTVQQKASFIKRLLAYTRPEGRNTFSDRSRIYRIRKTEKGSKVNATFQQLKAFVAEIDHLFPEEGITIDNIEYVSQASAA